MYSTRCPQSSCLPIRQLDHRILVKTDAIHTMDHVYRKRDNAHVTAE